MRSASNSATTAKTLNSNLPTASWGSYTDAPKLSRTCRAVSSSAMARASGRDRASRSSLVTPKVSLFQHGRLQAGQSVLAHGAAGAVGSVVTQLAREFGAYVIGTGRPADRQAALDFGANEFLDLDHEDLDDIGRVDLVFDVIGGDIQRRSASIIRPGGTLVSVVGPAEARPVDGLAIDFVVESVPSQLVEIADRVRDGRLRTHIGTVATLDEAIPALNPTQRRKGKTVIRVRP
jgi:NADPH:quinone reductase-like Zn-dependent oxidoreductase